MSRFGVNPIRLRQGGGTTRFLREDGTFAAAGGGPEIVTSVGGVLRCPLPSSTAQQIAQNTAHWCYVGYRPAGEVVKRIRVAVSTLAVGSQAAEVCLATSTTAPTGSNITLTKVWASGTLDDMTSGTGVKGNTSDNTTPIASASHVWLGIRCAFTGGGASNPHLHVVQRDWGAGFLARTSSAGVLTSGSSWTATPVTFANNTNTDIRGYL